jgi:predicted outer membrane lipoprotein
MDTRERLGPYALGLGSTYGYSGEDLANALEAQARGELPVQPDDAPATLELRIHGVGGAPAPVNLESPAAIQVAGDHRAGFYRAWYPGGSAGTQHLREAYCWGRLDTSWWTAFWALLMPFGLYNLAHWALPGTGGPALRYAARAVLRLQSLVLTGMLVATSCYVALDMLAWQGPQRDLLPSFLSWYAAWAPGWRLAGAAVPVFAVIAALWWLSHRTQGDYEQRSSGAGAPDEEGWALSSPRLWCGSRTVARQRDVHLIACAAVILVVESLPPVTRDAWLRAPVGVAGGVLAAVAVALTLSPWTDHERVPRPALPGELTRRKAFETAVYAVKWLAVGVASGVAVSRIWWTPDIRGAAALPYDSRLQLVFFWTALGSVLVLLAVVVGQRPWRQRDVMVRGFAGVGISLLATLVATIFTASLLQTVSQLIASPTFQTDAVPAYGQDQAAGFYLPSTAYAGGLAFGVALVVAVGTALVLLLVVSRLRARAIRREGRLLPALYGAHGYTGPDAEAAKQVAGTVATSRLTDLAGVVLLVVAVPTFVVLVGYQLWIEAGDIHLSPWARAGAYLATLATGAFLGWVRAAVTSSNARKRVGFVWDVITFWPRACHPLGPPSYGERSVPEVVTRLRRLTGDDVSDPEHDPALAQQAAEEHDAAGVRAGQPPSEVLLTGYSQGCPIAMAVVAQLPETARRRLRLLTLASPARRLYGRAFPSYFGADQLEVFQDRLTDREQTVRWVNLVRETDYIGGWVRARGGPEATQTEVDHWLRDPPVLWADADPSPPPTHLHSGWFSDEQVRPYADRLRDLPPNSPV